MEQILIGVLIAIVGKFLIDLVGWLMHMRKKVPLSKLGAKKGGWAVVTGCTGGIGEGYAREAAKEGFNVLLVSRDINKLNELQADMAQSTPGVKVDVAVFDFLKADKETWGKLEQTLGQLEVGLLVNNVGINIAHPTHFLETTAQENEDIIQVNIVCVERMTRAVLPGMVARKAGAIINLSSFTGRIPTPMLT